MGVACETGGDPVTQQFLTYSSNSGKFEKRMVINRSETTKIPNKVIKFCREDWRGCLAGFISQSSAITVVFVQLCLSRPPV